MRTAVFIGLALGFAAVLVIRARANPTQQQLIDATSRAHAVGADSLIAQYAPKGPGRR